MGIAIVIQNQVHQKIETITGRPSETLEKMIWDAPTGSMMWAIHGHADTMFNTTQLNVFLDEIAALSPRDDSEKELFSVLRNAAETAIRQRGYLWFSGD
ncbi:hypothetical protein [Nocardia sp. NPDC047654]|uniref:hypothetical protein n=1 Tax=Nocardia sp. NPDC047654 TaxID=3364314 RepID=UPI00371640A8